MKNNLYGQLEIVEAKEIKQSEKKKKQREFIESTVDRLSIIFDKVQKSKKYDRYIVSDREKWGVVDSKGNIIIPLKFTRITSSNDTFFRVYGENSGIFIQNKGGIIECKYQALYDYEGNELMPMSPYNKVISAGNNGLLFGFTTLQMEFNDVETNITYIGYDKRILKIDSRILCGNVNEHIQNLITLIDKDNKVYGLRIDKKFDIKQLNEVYDAIEPIVLRNYKTLTECEECLQISKEEAATVILSAVDTSSKLYIGTINNRRYLLNEHYRLKVDKKENNKYLWR